MICPRSWIAIMVAGVAFGAGAAAQQSSGGSSGAGGSSGGSAPATGSSGSTGSSPATPAAPAGSSSGAASSFGSPAAPSPAPTPAAPPVPGGAAPVPGGTTPPPTPSPGPGGAAGGGGAADTDAGAGGPSFTVPGLPGRPSETFRLLTRPRFRFFGSIGVGFDDNIFGTPTNGFSTPDQKVTVVTQPGQPARTEIVEVPGPTRIGGIRVEPQFRTTFVPEVPPVTEEITIPGVRAPARQSSLVERASVGTEVRFASRRTLFTLNLRLGAENTEARETDPLQYFGSLGATFAHKLLPRLQWDGGIDAAYGSQPDLSRINTPTNVTSGSYLNLVARTGLSYRWTPRITTSGSVTYVQNSFSDAAEQSNDYIGLTYSADARYLFNPRFALAVEYRYSLISYEFDTTRDSTTTFFLLGADWRLSPRTSTQIRLGVTARESETGDVALSPYLEFNLGYTLGKTSLLQWNVRYGFEEPSDSSSEVLTLRTGLNYLQFFTPRLRARAGLNILYTTTTNIASEESSTQTSFDTTLGFEYSLNRRWTFTGNYAFTTVFADNEFAEYYRNRLFLGLEYQF